MPLYTHFSFWVYDYNCVHVIIKLFFLWVKLLRHNNTLFNQIQFYILRNLFVVTIRVTKRVLQLRKLYDDRCVAFESSYAQVPVKSNQYCVYLRVRKCA